MTDMRTYFRKSGMEVREWWKPEESHAALLYERGNNLVRGLSAELERDSIVLDAACGKGRVSEILVEHHQAVALDISPDMLGVFDYSTKLKCSLVGGDVGALPFADQTFDAIVCLEALVHFDGLSSVFEEFQRVLKPGGCLLISYDNKWGLLRVLKNSINRMISVFDHNYALERERRRMIFTPRGHSEINQLLKQHGFSIERRTFIGVIMPFVIRERILFSSKVYAHVCSLLDGLDSTPGLRRLATYTYVVAKRCNMSPI